MNSFVAPDETKPGELMAHLCQVVDASVRVVWPVCVGMDKAAQAEVWPQTLAFGVGRMGRQLAW